MPAVSDIGYQAALARIQEITGAVNPAPAQTAAATTASPTAFAAQLAQAQSGTSPATISAYTDQTRSIPAAAAAPDAPAGTGARIAQIAQAELGVSEQPPGSNNGPRIAEYRTATANSGVGPWCAYFCSWVAKQAGVPIGPGGRGEGWVPNVESWGKQTGRWIPPGGATPRAGDLVVFDRDGDGTTDHIGVVTGVRSDGGITTVEGNSSNAVSARSYAPGGWTGLVRVVPNG